MPLHHCLALRLGALAPVPVPSWVLDGASVDLDFAGERYFTPTDVTQAGNVACVRSADALADNADGTWSSFGNNVARITDKGLLVEEARTNVIRNSAASGASAGTPGTLPTNWSTSLALGITRAVVASGTEFGLPYVDIRYQGTPASTSEALTLIPDNLGTAFSPASNGQSWTVSVFARLVAGSPANVGTFKVQILGRDSGSSAVSSTTSIGATLGAAFQRISHSHTMNNPNVAYVNAKFLLDASNTSTAIDVTVRYYAPQIELGAFPTSPILTTSVAAARTADVISLTGAAANAALAARAAYFEGGASAGVSNARLITYATQRITTSVNSRVRNSDGTINIDASLGSGLISTGFRAAFGYDASSFTAIGNGGALASQPTPYGALAGPVILGSITGGNGTANFNGYIRRVAFGPTKGMFDSLTV